MEESSFESNEFIEQNLSKMNINEKNLEKLFEKKDISDNDDISNNSNLLENSESIKVEFNSNYLDKIFTNPSDLINDLNFFLDENESL